MALETLLVLVNATACLVVFYVAASFYFARGEPKDAWSLALQLGLLVLMAASIGSPLAALQAGETPAWWAMGQRIGGAAVALCLYDWRFGFVRQGRQLRAGLARRAAAARECWALLRRPK